MTFNSLFSSFYFGLLVFFITVPEDTLGQIILYSLTVGFPTGARNPLIIFEYY